HADIDPTTHLTSRVLRELTSCSSPRLLLSAHTFYLELFAEKWDQAYPASSRIWRTHWSYMGPLFNSPARRRDSLSYLDDFHSGCRWGYCRVPDWRNESVNWSSDGERPIEERTTIFPPGSVSSCPKR